MGISCSIEVTLNPGSTTCPIGSAISRFPESAPGCQPCMFGWSPTANNNCCIPCGNHVYCDEGKQIGCGSGSFLTSGIVGSSTDPIFCDTCNSGTWSALTANTDTGCGNTCSVSVSTTCDPRSGDQLCNIGYYLASDNTCTACRSYGSNADETNGICVSCDVNSALCSPTGVILYCNAGYQLDSFNNVCQLCPQGTYQASINSFSTCSRVCPTGSVCSATGIVPSCPVGQQIDPLNNMQCQTCSIGTFQTTLNTLTTCSGVCPSGSVCDRATGIVSSCPVGQQIDPLNNMHCQTCSTGTFQTTLNALTTCSGICSNGSNCDPASGIITSCVGGFNFKSSTCIVCDPNTFNANGNFGIACAACPLNSGCDSTSGLIQTCNPGYLFNSNGLSCDVCLEGTFSGVNNALSTCSGNCNDNSLTCDPILGTVLSCKPGFKINSLNTVQCQQCSKGTFISTANTLNTCLPCTSNSYCNSLTGALVSCDAGYFPNSQACQLCRSGTFSDDQYTSLTCEICPSNSICGITTGIIESCNPGYFIGLLNNLAGCQRCSPLTFSTNQNSGSSCLGVCDIRASTCDSITGLATVCLDSTDILDAGICVAFVAPAPQAPTSTTSTTASISSTTMASSTKPSYLSSTLSILSSISSSSSSSSTTTLISSSVVVTSSSSSSITTSTIVLKPLTSSNTFTTKAASSTRALTTTTSSSALTPAQSAAALLQRAIEAIIASIAVGISNAAAQIARNRGS